jgi:hypothetical protein
MSKTKKTPSAKTATKAPKAKKADIKAAVEETRAADDAVNAVSVNPDIVPLKDAMGTKAKGGKKAKAEKPAKAPRPSGLSAAYQVQGDGRKGPRGGNVENRRQDPRGHHLRRDHPGDPGQGCREPVPQDRQGNVRGSKAVDIVQIAVIPPPAIAGIFSVATRDSGVHGLGADPGCSSTSTPIIDLRLSCRAKPLSQATAAVGGDLAVRTIFAT